MHIINYTSYSGKKEEGERRRERESFFFLFNSLAPQKQSSQQLDRKTLAREKLRLIQQQGEGEKEAICYLELMKYETLFLILVFRYSASWWLGWNSIFGVKTGGKERERERKEGNILQPLCLFICFNPVIEEQTSFKCLHNQLDVLLT